MILNLFKTKPVVEDSVHNWIVDTYAWALTHLNSDFFKAQSQLILPTNAYYPGRVSSVHEMAQQVFNQTVKYAGMENWQLKLIEPHQSMSAELPKLATTSLLRGEGASIGVISAEQHNDALAVSFNGESITKQNKDNQQVIEISYNPSQVNQPQDLVSSFAQMLASLLVLHAPETPPGGKEYMSQAIDLVACFMGFGVIFSNTAFQFRGGCGSCNNRQANRQSTLTEVETVYCLAVFAHLKGVKNSEVLPYLKGHLKKTYKDSVKQISQQGVIL